MADIKGARQTVHHRILEGTGHAPHEQRRAAFDNNDVPESIRALVEKVAKHAYKICDEDIDAAKAAGFTEDQLFELTVCAAIGQASRQYDNALAALDAATASGAGGAASKVAASKE